jgi:hypothetical protein
MAVVGLEYDWHAEMQGQQDEGEELDESIHDDANVIRHS